MRQGIDQVHDHDLEDLLDAYRKVIHEALDEATIEKIRELVRAVKARIPSDIQCRRSG
jgi:hypothetical protein